MTEPQQPRVDVPTGHALPPRNDNRPPAEPGTIGRAAAGEIVGALRFYSRLTIPFGPHLPLSLTHAAPVLPLISLLLALPPSIVLVVGIWFGLPSVYAAGLAVAASLLLTGAMAEDALADAFDGLFGGPSPEVRLDIMRDSRHGTYGVSALVLFLLLRVFAVGAIGAVHPFAGAGALVAASLLGRSGSLWLTVALPPARRDGVSASAGRVLASAFIVGAVVAVALAAVVTIPFAGPAAIVIILCVAAAVALGWTILCRRLVGGQTGDCVGALQALIELATLTVLLAFA